MKILFLSSWFPYPPDNGSRIRALNLIRELSRQHELTLLAFSRNGEVSEERLQAMRDDCSAVRAVPLPPFRPTSFRSIVGFFSVQPRSFVDTYSPRMSRLVQDVLRRQSFDVIVACQLDAAPYVPTTQETPAILEELQLTVLREQYVRQRRPDLRLRYGLMWWKMERFVARLLARFDGCTVVSEEERVHVLDVAPSCRVELVPNGVDWDFYQGDFGTMQPDTLVFPGALTYEANFDAMVFFLEEIFPEIQRQRPQALLRITGRTTGVCLERLPLNDGVTLTGYLDDVRPTVGQSSVCVVPLRIGGGTRLKILEAMAIGTPVVSTMKGAEGLAVTPEENILIADEPAAFADAVNRLLTSPTLRNRLVQGGRRLVREQYTWTGSGRKLNQFLERVTRKQDSG